MSNNRELSQLASLITIDDTNRSIGITTSVGIGTTNPTSALTVKGNTSLETLNVSGVSTFAGAIDANGDLDVDGHTELDNLNVSGISTFAGAIDANGDLDVDGHTELDNVNISGVTTFAGAIDANGDLDVDGVTELDITNISETLNVVGLSTFASDVDINASIDIDGHTELDDLNVTGVSTFQDDVDITGNLAVDANTLFVNATNNRIGIGTAVPAYQVEIENTGANALLVLDRTDGAACFIEGQATRSAFGSVNATPLALAYNSFAVVTIGAGGSIRVNPDGDGYTFPTTDGSANQVLQTDGEGNLSFATVSGGGVGYFVQNSTGIHTTSNVGIGTTNLGARLHVTPSSTGIAGIFSGTTSSDMVRITQTGSGNAFVVEDNTNPDATPFVIMADGKVGVGTTGVIKYSSGANDTSTFGILAPTGNDSPFVLKGNNGSTTDGSGQTFAVLVGSGGGTGSGTIIAHLSHNTSGIGTRRNAIRFTDNQIRFEDNASGSVNVLINSAGGGELVVGSTSLTGTASQPLQVSGGAYVSDNAGIGTTNPTSKLHIIGDTLVSGVVTATTFSGQVNAGVSTVTNLSASQINVSGLSTFAGITTVTGTTLFSRQLNVSGLSTFNNTLNVIPTSTGIAGLFSGTTSSDMVHITQLGTGNALLVEDSANPDATPFVVTGIGSVGIGTTNPLTKLDIIGSNFNTFAENNIGVPVTISIGGDDAYDSGTAGAGVAFVGRWSSTNPNLTTMGIIGAVKENKTSGNYGSALVFMPRTNGQASGANEKMRLSSTGNLGIGTTNPGAQLHVVPTSTSISGLFSGTTSGDMVRITQLGTGNALVVEDESNPDSTPFVVAASGAVGAGTTLPLIAGSNHGGLTISGSDTARLYFEDTGYEATGSGVGQFIYDNGNLAWFTGNRSGSTTTGSTEAFRVLESGNLGIGTTNPLSKLHVYFDNPEIVVVERQTNNHSLIQYKNPLGSIYTGMTPNALGWGIDVDTNVATSPIFLARRSGEVLIGTGTTTGTASQTLQVTGGAYVSGSVGIGTTNPQYLLHANGSGTQYLCVSSTTGGYDATSLLGSTSQGSFIINQSTTLPTQIWTNGNPRITINSSGNVLIGSATSTGTASQTLQVTGGAYVSGSVGIGTTDPTIGIGNSFHVSKVQIVDTISDASTEGAYSVVIDTLLNGTQTPPANDAEQGALYVKTVSDVTSGNTSNEHQVYGISNQVLVTGDSDLVVPSINSATISHTTGTVSSYYNYDLVSSTATSTITSMYGRYMLAQPTTGSSGSITTLVGARIRANFAGTSGVTATNVYGVWANLDRDSASASVTGVSALFYGSYDTTSGYANPYGIYIATNVKNYLRGNVGINSTLPLTNLDLNNGILGFCGGRLNVVIGDETTGTSLLSGAGEENVVIGSGAGVADGYYNVIIGALTGSTTNNGANNCIVGYAAGSSISETTGNTFIGDSAGNTVTTGSSNTYIGANTGAINETGGNNVAVGVGAGSARADRDNNTYIGAYSGYVTEGANCTYIGYGAGFGAGDPILGSNIVCIGYDVTPPSLSASTQLAIGHGTNRWIVGNSSFNIGIGTTNPGTNKLQVQGNIKATSSIDTDTQFLGQPNDTASTPSFSWTSDTTTGFYKPSSGNLGFTISGTERLRLNTTGVGIGTISPGAALDVQGLIRVRDTTSNGTFTSPGNIAIKDNSSDPYISFHESDGTRNAYIQSVDTTGLFIVQEDAQPLTIRTVQSQSIIFQTANAEEMRITGAGLVGIGTDVPGTTLHVHEVQTGTTPLVRIQNSATTAANNAILLELFYSGDADVSGAGSSAHYIRFRDNNNNPTGQISGASATTVLYATASDYRLKEDIAPSVDGIERVMQLKPCNFTWKDSQVRSEGFIAHEVQSVVPQAVVGSKDAVNEEGNMEPQMIDTSQLVVVLTTALQEAVKRIEYLESIVGIGLS